MLSLFFKKLFTKNGSMIFSVTFEKKMNEKGTPLYIFSQSFVFCDCFYKVCHDRLTAKTNINLNSSKTARLTILKLAPFGSPAILGK